MRVGDIFMSGVQIGTIEVLISRDEANLTPQFPFNSLGPDPLPDTDDDLTPHGYGPTYEPSQGSRDHSRAPKTRNRSRDTAEKPKKRPTFRRGTGPGSVNYPREHLGGKPPPKITLGDVKSQVEGGGRARFREELISNPALRTKVLTLMANEQALNPEGTQGIAESMMNRAAARGTSLGQAAKWFTEGRGGYYDDKNNPSTRRNAEAAVRDPKSRAILEAALERALGGSNITNYATDNASGSFARGEIAEKSFDYREKINGEYFLVPNIYGRRGQPDRRRQWEEWMKKGAPLGGGAGAPIVPLERERRQTHEKAEPTFSDKRLGQIPPRGPTNIERDRRADTFADRPHTPTVDGDPYNGVVRQAPGGDTQAFIVHHTGGRGTPEGVVADWRQHRPGIGTQYIMDREGRIHDVAAEFNYHGHGHIITGTGVGAGLSNRNAVGMEIIARDDRDVTPQQARAARDFIQRHYSNVPVYGHGEVNPGHREASEGMTVVDMVRGARANRETPGQTAARPPPGPTEARPARNTIALPSATAEQHFQHGGVVTRPTKAVMGEAGPELRVGQRHSMLITHPTRTTIGTEGPEAVIPLHARAFVRAIARTETDFDPRSAYSETYNMPHHQYKPAAAQSMAGYNPNVRAMGSRGADYGYFQMNQTDVERGIAMGMRPESAEHLHGGGQAGSRSSTYAQQESAVHDYIKRRWPAEYSNLVNRGDYEGLRKAAVGTWHGLSQQEKAKREYEETLGARPQAQR